MKWDEIHYLTKFFILILIPPVILFLIIYLAVDDVLCTKKYGGTCYYGYKNTNNGKCENFCSCIKDKIPRKYIFNKQCWYSDLNPYHKQLYFLSPSLVEIEIINFCLVKCNESKIGYNPDYCEAGLKVGGKIRRCSEVYNG